MDITQPDRIIGRSIFSYKSFAQAWIELSKIFWCKKYYFFYVGPTNVGYLFTTFYNIYFSQQLVTHMKYLYFEDYIFT